MTRKRKHDPAIENFVPDYNCQAFDSLEKFLADYRTRLAECVTELRTAIQEDEASGALNSEQAEILRDFATGTDPVLEKLVALEDSLKPRH